VIAHGQFGYIDVGIYELYGKKKEVYIKRPIVSQNLTYEACIQKLVHESLASIGFPLGSPPVIDIFALNGSVCFAMEPIQGASTLNHYLDTVADITVVLIDCLLQLCGMLSHIGSHLGINHRDLKPSNFLIVEHEPRMKRFAIETESIMIASRHSLTMIDFGFACLGSSAVSVASGRSSSAVTHLSLSDVYPPGDLCPKEGRDLFLFLGLLYLDYHAKLPPTLCGLFESWLNPSLCRFMRKDKVHSMQWLYFMAGNESIQKFQSPLRIFKDLQAL
jgi:serine/threonine protein kinase